MNNRVKDLKKQLLVDPKIEDSIRTALDELLNPRELPTHEPEGGFSEAIGGADTFRRLWAAANAILALRGNDDRFPRGLDLNRLLRHLTADISFAIWFSDLNQHPDLGPAVISEALEQALRLFEYGQETRGVVVLEKRFEQVRSELIDATERRQQAYFNRLLESGDWEAVSKYQSKKFGNRDEARDRFKRRMDQIDRRATEEAKRPFSEISEAAELLMMCGDSTLGMLLDLGNHQPGEGFTHDPHDFEGVCAKGEDFIQVLEQLTKGIDLYLSNKMKSERGELGGLIEFDPDEPALWVVNKGGRTRLGRAIAANVYDYLLLVLPAPYLTEAGKSGPDRRYNKIALELATRLANSVYLGTKVLPQAITSDQVRDTHKSRLLRESQQ